MSKKGMTKEEMVCLVRETWEKYGQIDHSGLTSYEHNKIDDMLDDVERLVRD